MRWPVIAVIGLIHDTSPNAFATGRGPQDAKIAITTGLLDDLYPNRLGSAWQSFADKRCPVCDTALKGMPLPSRSHIIIDRCEQGHGIWFDDGELAAAVQKRTKTSPEAET